MIQVNDKLLILYLEEFKSKKPKIMALDIDIQIINVDGNPIEGSCMQVGKEGRSLVNAFEHEVESPVSASTGRATGKRQHKAVKIWKEIDKATPVMADALYKNARLPSAEIRFWKPSPDGTEDNHFTCTLENVRIISHSVNQLHNRFDNGLDMSIAAFDVFELAYERITYTHTEDGITASDAWGSASRTSSVRKAPTIKR